MIIIPRDDIPHAYVVQSGKEVYNVNLSLTDYGCDCADYLWRDRRCKHLQAVERLRAEAITNEEL